MSQTVQEPKAITARKTVGRILIRGYIINPYGPSYELLERRVNVSDIPRYMQWKERFEDLLNKLDAKHAKVDTQKLKGRTLKAFYKTVFRDDNGKTVKERVRVLKFHPYPGVFGSRINYLKNRLYGSGSGSTDGILTKRCIILAQEKRGHMTRTVYLAPYDQAPFLYAEVDELNVSIEELQKQITEYEKSEDFREILRYVQTAEKVFLDKEGKPTVSTKLHPIYLNPQPLEISPRIYEEYLEEKAAALTRELDAKYLRGHELMEKELRDATRNTVETAVLHLQRRIGSIAEKLASVIEAADLTKAKRTATALARHVADIQSLMESTNCSPFLASKLDAIKNLVEAVRTKDTATIEEANKNLAEEMELKNEKQALKETSKLLAKGLDNKVRNLIQDMM